MADNLISDPGAGGAEFATDDIGGVHYPRTKVTWGPDGTANDTDDATGKRLPVNIAESIPVPVTDNGGSLTVDGTVAVTNAGMTELAAAINASSQMDVNIAASAATVPVSNAGLTELAAAINASSQVDVNLAASAATLTVASHAVTNAGTFATQASQSGTWNIGTVTAVTAITDVVHVDDNASTLSVDDGGSSLTVDGTVAVTNAGLTELAAAINASSQMDVNIAASGATLTVGSHAVTNAGTFAVQAAQSGTWNVGTVTAVTALTNALPAGTNNIGDVDVLSVVPGTAATNLGKAEDAAHTTGDVGVMALAVRQTSQADFGADGDYVPFSVDDDGGLRVSIVAGAGSGGTAAADDADFAAGATLGTPAMGVYESAPSSVTDGDLGTVGITQTRALRTVVEGTAAVSNAGLTELAGAINASAQMDVNIAASAATLTVASHAVTNAGTFATQATQAGTWNIGTLATVTNVVHVDDNAGTLSIDDGGGIITVDGTVAVTNAGLTELAAAINASSQMDVNIAASAATLTVAAHAVTNAGTFATQVDGAALTSLQLIDNPVVVDDAAFFPGASSVMMAGFEFDDATPDSVNEGDAGAARMSANRNIYTTIRDAAGNERGVNVNASSQLAVSVDNTVTVASHAVTNAGTFAVQSAAAGDIAHDAADSGNPLKVGAKATTAITGITAVVNNDRTQLYAGTDGVLLVRENANLESLSRGTAAITDGSSTSVIAAAGANIKTYITDVIISNSSATYVTVDIRDGTAGSVMATFPAPATSGCVHRVGSPFAGTANTAVAADPSAAASTVSVTLLGFKSLI